MLLNNNSPLLHDLQKEAEFSHCAQLLSHERHEVPLLYVPLGQLLRHWFAFTNVFAGHEATHVLVST
jgi:hypothetical protein